MVKQPARVKQAKFKDRRLEAKQEIEEILSVFSQRIKAVERENGVVLDSIQALKADYDYLTERFLRALISLAKASQLEPDQLVGGVDISWKPCARESDQGGEPLAQESEDRSLDLIREDSTPY